MAYYAGSSLTVEAYSTGLPGVVSLTAASAASNGSILDGLCVRQNAVISVTLSAAATGGAVQLQASLDGVNFWNAGSAITPTTAGTSATVVQNVMGRYFRAAITTPIAGAGSPTVTVSVGCSG